ncbi:MAG: hypothetical protein IPK79_12125 [Vampirovibrionales bacterium]|nr:hypothetical protein [Vampirovibrionales bacterium]
MIIKRRKLEKLLEEGAFIAAPPPPPASREADSSETSASAHAQPVEPALEWNEQTVEHGLVSDRRARDRQSGERRRGYRRLEDRALISRANDEATAIRENAAREGFENGLQQAHESIRALQENLEALLAGRADALMTIADEIAPLAVEIAERIIKTEVSCDETLVRGIVDDTLQKVSRSNKSVLIKVHPDDVRLVKDSLRQKPPSHLNAEIMVMDDPAVDRGSCVVETNSGLIDATFSTRLEMLRRLFGGAG